MSGHLAAPGDVGAVALAADGKTAFIAVEGTGGAWLGRARRRGDLDRRRARSGAAARRRIRRNGPVADGLPRGRRRTAVRRRPARPAGGPLAPGGGTMAVAAFDVADPARLSEVGRWTARRTATRTRRRRWPRSGRGSSWRRGTAGCSCSRGR
ncbi:MAG: hypothetical protein U0470_02830 [Anaerolineae bacterium]